MVLIRHGASSNAVRRNKWLNTTAPAYDECIEEWTRNEKLILGGKNVVDSELILFDWELEQGPRAKARRGSAVYVNYPERMADIMLGHLWENAPTPEDTLDFGGLGEVPRARNSARPSPAEMIYYNADGLGRDGSQWDPYWKSVTRMAMATGHRWIYVEGPPAAPQSRADEINGLRPYLTDYSPRAVTNWHYEDGRLAFAIIRRAVRRPRIQNGNFVGNLPTIEYLFVTREGFSDFGAQYGDGGWFLFDFEGDLLDFEVGWEDTNGEIPMVPLYYQRIRPQENLNRISRAATTEIGNAAVLNMNLDSAANFDLWDNAASAKALAGVDKEGYNLFMEIVKSGSRFAPLPTNEDTKQKPEVQDITQGAALAQAFATRLGQNKQHVGELMLNEIQTAPDASGSSKRASWSDVRAPRLADMASNVETAQNAVLPWLEGMWGERAPSASVAWKRNFDLIDPMAAGATFFETERVAGMRSKTLDRKILVSMAKSSGFLGDDVEQKTVENEYDESARKAEEMMNSAAQLGSLLGGSNNNPNNPPRGSKTAPGDGRNRRNQGFQNTRTGSNIPRAT